MEIASRVYLLEVGEVVRQRVRRDVPRRRQHPSAYLGY